jgi:hypothetical protein
MKTIVRRVSKLEERFAARREEPGRTVIDVLLEGRRRCRLAAEGHEPEEYPPLENFNQAGDRPWTLAERMRRRFELRRLSMEQLERAAEESVSLSKTVDSEQS